MVTRAILVENSSGLHTRPGTKFVNMAKTYDCDIKLQKGEKIVNAKSLLKVLSCGIKKGAEIFIHAEGNDEEKAVNELSQFIINLKEGHE